MIYDMLTNVEKYRGISKNLDTAIDFLVKTDLSALPLGQTEIDGDNVFANVMEAQAKPVEELNFEIHKKYMDIQIDIEGTEVICIGLGEAKELTPFSGDFGTVTVENSSTCIMGPGRFIVCMTEEPHLPSAAASEDLHLKKCVIKVAAY